MTTDENETVLGPRDRKELARMLGKYGRETIVAAAEALPLPKPRGRPRGTADPSKDAEEIAEFIWRYAAMHRASRSKKPIHEALMDLYDLIEDWRPRRRDFDVWSRTILRKRRSVKWVAKYLERTKVAALKRRAQERLEHAKVGSARRTLRGVTKRKAIRAPDFGGRENPAN